MSAFLSITHPFLSNSDNRSEGRVNSLRNPETDASFPKEFLIKKSSLTFLGSSFEKEFVSMSRHSQSYKTHRFY